MHKIALITGASRGLGKDMALTLANQGIDSIITYQSQKEKANEVVAQIEQAGRKSVALPLDVAKPDTWPAFMQEVVKVLKQHWNTDKFDFLINNAGIGSTLPIAQVTPEVFDNLMNIHFKSVVFITQQSLPLLNDGGRLINISTGTTRFCIPGNAIYASCKSAIETFTRYLAKEVGERGITANVVAPGGIETDFNGAAIRNNPQLKAYLSSQTALGRVGQPDDVSGVVAFLCSPASKWVNAQRIEASGGVFL